MPSVLTPRPLHTRVVAPLAFAIVLGSGCSGSSAPAHPDGGYLPTDVGLMLAETDGEPGGALVEAIDPSTHTLVQHRGTAFDEDPRLRRLVDPTSASERFFLVGAATGQLTEVSQSGAIVSQWSVLDDGGVGQGASPRDVAIGSDGALWITRKNKPGLRVLEPDGRPRRTVDLSAFAEVDSPTDRSTGMTAIAIVGTTAYVALSLPSATQTMTHDAKIVAIDTTTYVASAFLDLPLRGPLDRFVLEPGETTPRLWLACAGDDNVGTKRGLVSIDLDAKSIAATIDWTTIGLSPIAFTIAGTHEGFAIGTSPLVSGPGSSTSIVGFDPGTPGSAVQTILRSADAPRLTDVAVANDFLLVTEADPGSYGVIVFDRLDGSRHGFVSAELPPVGLLVLRPPP